MKILAIGPLWRGSNAGGLFRALSRQGCLIEVIDEFYFISLQTKRKFTKIVERTIRPLQEEEFNEAIKNKIQVFRPDILFVYKGMFVKPGTLSFALLNNCKPVLFYPDVSMTFHGPNIVRSLPLYDLIFTTKTFGLTDLQKISSVKKAFFIPHGFDPEIHRPLPVSEEDIKIFGCDVSFIGTWSPKKELWLTKLRESLPGITLRIWGGQWSRSGTAAIKPCLQNTTVLGDIYALAIQCSKINLGILSEQVEGASSGDLITSRTFHIPAAGGFLLHERNNESVLYYQENEESGFFEGYEELINKVNYFLSDNAIREKIRLAGHKRALTEYSLDERAKTIINEIKMLQ